jgi:hypothetical protein
MDLSPGTVYLLHFLEPIGNPANRRAMAQHYTGKPASSGLLPGRWRRTCRSGGSERWLRAGSRLVLAGACLAAGRSKR